MNHRAAQHSDLLFWGLPVLSGIVGAIIFIAAGRHGPGTVGHICLGALVIYPPVVVGVHASRRGLPEDRVGMLIIKNGLLKGPTASEARSLSETI
jgi:hypothetical protein